MKTQTQNARAGNLTWVSCSIPAEHLAALDEMARQTYSNRSAHMRLAVARYVKEEAEKSNAERK